MKNEMLTRQFVRAVKRIPKDPRRILPSSPNIWKNMGIQETQYGRIWYVTQEVRGKILEVGFGLDAMSENGVFINSDVEKNTSNIDCIAFADFTAQPVSRHGQSRLDGIRIEQAVSASIRDVSLNGPLTVEYDWDGAMDSVDLLLISDERNHKEISAHIQRGDLASLRRRIPGVGQMCNVQGFRGKPEIKLLIGRNYEKHRRHPAAGGIVLADNDTGYVLAMRPLRLKSPEDVFAVVRREIRRYLQGSSTPKRSVPA